MTAGLNCRISVLKDVSGRLHPYRVNSEELVVRSASGGTSCPPSISVTSTHLSHFSTLTSLWFIFNPQSRSTEPKQIRPNSFTRHVFFFFTSAHPCTYCKPKLLRCKAEMINLTEVKTSHSYTQIWTLSDVRQKSSLFCTICFVLRSNKTISDSVLGWNFALLPLKKVTKEQNVPTTQWRERVEAVTPAAGRLPALHLQSRPPPRASWLPSLVSPSEAPVGQHMKRLQMRWWFYWREHFYVRS